MGSNMEEVYIVKDEYGILHAFSTHNKAIRFLEANGYRYDSLCPYGEWYRVNDELDLAYAEIITCRIQ